MSGSSPLGEHWCEAGGTRLFALAAGRGPCLFMLHGGMADHRAVLPLVGSLTDRVRVVAPDQRGSGRSWCGDTLTFDRLADDVAAWMDQMGVAQAFVGGASSGTGVALRFALRHPARLLGLVLVTPVYAGAELGYTSEQRATFTFMDQLASRALDEGVQVLRPLYASLPEAVREKALAMVEGFDAASVVATSRFIASGAQPFASASDLQGISAPTLLVRGNDPLHPASVSDLYVSQLPRCTTLPAGTPEVAEAIGAFCEA